MRPRVRESDTGCAVPAVDASRRRRPGVVSLAAVAMTAFGVGTARAATTDVYLDFAFASPPGWQYQNYLDWANRGNINTIAETPLLAY